MGVGGGGGLLNMFTTIKQCFTVCTCGEKVCVNVLGICVYWAYVCIGRMCVVFLHAQVTHLSPPPVSCTSGHVFAMKRGGG